MTPAVNGSQENLRPSTVFGVCAALFAVRVLPWMLSDLWHDEVITVGDFVFGPPGSGLGRVFRSYPVANNHILFSALGWCWVRMGSVFSSDFGMRLLPFGLSLATLWVVSVGWRRWLGARLAMVAGLTFACSPVFGPFAWQFRGYALSMLLGAVAVGAVFDLLDGDRRRGMALGVVAFAALPLVIPGNILLPAGLLLFIGLRGMRSGDTWCETAGLCWPLACAASVGGGYYLTIWPQFRAVLAQTTGWESGTDAALLLVAAFVAHVGLYTLVRMLDRSGETRAGDVPCRSRDGLLLLLCLGAVLIPVLFLLERAPYPRAFLVFWPALTLGVFLLGGRPGMLRRMRPLVLVGVFLVYGFVWDRGTEEAARQRLVEGEFPQNLLVQYYRGSNGLSMLCGWIHDKQELGPEPVVVTDFYDFPAFRYYWGMRGMDTHRVVRLTDADAVAQIRRRGGGTFSLVATGEIEAARMFAAIGMAGPFRAVFSVGDRTLYAPIDG